MHYGRIYLPLDKSEQEEDQAAFEAYMAKKEAEEAAAKARAEEEKAKEEAARVAREAHESGARVMAEREAMALKEDRDLVSRLVWRIMDRRESGLRYRVNWAPVQAQLRRLGIDWEIRGSRSAWKLTEQFLMLVALPVRAEYGVRTSLDQNS